MRVLAFIGVFATEFYLARARAVVIAIVKREIAEREAVANTVRVRLDDRARLRFKADRAEEHTNRDDKQQIRADHGKSIRERPELGGGFGFREPAVVIPRCLLKSALLI